MGGLPRDLWKVERESEYDDAGSMSYLPGLAGFPVRRDLLRSYL